MSADRASADEALDALRAFGVPVLTYLDADGRPASVRAPVAPAGEAIIATLPAGAPAPTPGPANLLGHAHDEQLWNLRQTMVRGEVVAVDDATTVRFVPGRIVVGARPGLRAQVQLLRRCRRTAAAWLERRGLERQPVDWASVDRVARRVAQE